MSKQRKRRLAVNPHVPIGGRHMSDIATAHAVELMKDREALGQALRAAREQKGWSLVRVADSMGVSVDTVRRWEHGRFLRVHTVVTLMNLLDLPGSPAITLPSNAPQRVLDALQTVYDLTEGRGPLWEKVEHALFSGLEQIRRLAQEPRRNSGGHRSNPRDGQTTS